TEFEATIGDSATISKSQAILRLDLTLRWEGQAISEESKESVISYDLLISDIDSASPRVTSWGAPGTGPDRKSTRLNSSHVSISYAVFCLKKKRLRHT